MMDVFNSFSLTGVAANLTGALGVEAPKFAEAPNPFMKTLIEESPLLKETSHGRKVDRVLMYNPDAVALWLYQKYTEKYAPVVKNTQVTLPLATVMPSVTPVCFSTMYTGALPEVHGIKVYEKPVQHTDSVFDALIRAGKKPCIISCTPNCSMSLIWKERDMDYFIFDKVPEVLEKALEVIPEDKYDMVVVYNHNYDSRMHKTGAESEDSLAQLDDNCRTFGLLCDAVREHWKDHNTLVGFAPDHGCHDTDKDSGTHGLYMSEDINIMHFYGII